jgi:cell wall-associated NlpC family hydrolase
MNVMKKFGVSFVCLLFVSLFSMGQTIDICNPKQTQSFVPLRTDVNQYITQFIPKSKVNVDVKPIGTKQALEQDLHLTRTFKKEEAKKSSTAVFANNMMDWLKDKYATMIDVMPNQLSNGMLYSFIDDWYGTKYRMGGTSKKGIDCSAFTQNLYKYVFGMNIVRTACLQFNASQRIKNVGELREGDLVFFRVNTSRISHVGVYLSNNYFVHSACTRGVSISSLNNSYWSKFYAGGGRIIEN